VALELEVHRSGAPDPRHASKRPVPVTFVAALIMAVGVYNVVAEAEPDVALPEIGLTHQLLRHFFYDHASYVNLALMTLVVFALTPLDVLGRNCCKGDPSLTSSSRQPHRRR
jgi:hypothetical protein